MLGIAVVYVLIYCFAYDKSYYHIDTVREPMIRFMFMESMLLGAYFRVQDSNFRNVRRISDIVLSLICFILYFGSKLAFSRIESLAFLQIINQFILFALLFFILRLFSGLDSLLECLPKKIIILVNYISRITLEIYVVQYVIIDALRSVAVFPLNWICLTGAILIAASVLHYVSGLVSKPILAHLKN